MLREPTEGKIGRAVLAIALALATVMLILTLGSFIGLTVQRHFQAERMYDRKAFHTAPQPPEHPHP